MTQLIFGTWQIAGAPSFRECSEEKALEVLEYAYKKGIHTFDTAPIYGFGKSEELLGKFLSGKKRENIKIITKFGFDWGDNYNTYIDFSTEGIQKQLQKSLKRLQTDYIDTYLLHVPDNHVHPDELLPMLNKLKQEGKIKSYGVCNMYDKQLQSFLHHPLSQIEYIQDFYNLIEKKAETLIFPYLKTHHKFLAYSPLYRGVLTSLPLDTLLKKDEDAINMVIKNQSLPHVYKQKLLYEAAARKKGVALEKLALDFLHNKPEVSGIIVGTTNTSHLESIT